MQRYMDKHSVVPKNFYSHLIQIYFSIKLGAKDVLEIGTGYKFVSSVLKNYCNLTTLDFDEKFKPDILMDITQLKELDKLQDNGYDLIIICEVLEHIPYNKIDGILKILKKKTRKYIVLSVPNQSGYCNITLYRYGIDKFSFKIIKFFLATLPIMIGRFFSMLDYKLRKRRKKFKIKGKEYHQWELGISKHNLYLFRKLLKKHFEIRNEERIQEHPFHHFFILKKRLDK